MMMTLFLKSYFAIILTIAITAISFFSLGAYCLLRRFFSLPTKTKTKTMTVDIIEEEDQNLSAIAGEDLVSTQLDLARAYIETNQKPLALVILTQITQKGTPLQQQEAHELLNYL
jgi:FimV-like protein